jgi:hypothetical protein
MMRRKPSQTADKAGIIIFLLSENGHKEADKNAEDQDRDLQEE